MKYPKESSYMLSYIGLIQLILFIIGIATHDWFWFIAVYILNPNIRWVINYNGAED